MRRWVALVAGCGMAAQAMAWQTLPAWNSDDPNFRYTPSPGDWRSQNIYQIVTDRFSDGDPNNNRARGGYDPAQGSRAHGGDFKGIEQRLDYLKELGVTTIWISPVTWNVDRDFNGDFPYHSYMPTDLNRIESQFGSLHDLRSLVYQAHRRGMYVVLDAVVNHLADLISSRYGNNKAYNPGGYWDMWWHRGYAHAAPFDTLSRFHNNGAINNWEDPNQYLRGEMTGGLDDLMTEDPGVRGDLAAIYKALISATDCDGFRIDAVKHVEMDFWKSFLPSIRAHAAWLGKTNFLVFGEVYSGDDGFVGSYTGPDRFHSMLDFPMFEASRDVFVYGKATTNLSGKVEALSKYDAVARGQLVSFLDSHDEPRLLSGGYLRDDWGRLKVALAWHYTSPTIPCLYYGTEQGFNGGDDPWNREDMWDGGFEYGPSSGDNFNTGHELFKYVKRLNELRAQVPVLATGAFRQRWQDHAGRGIFAYTKTEGTNEALVVLNTAGVSRSCHPAVTRPPGTALQNLLDPSDTAKVGADGTVALTVGPNSAKIFVPFDGRVALQWVGATFHWPTNGALAATNDLWINTESWPRSAGVTGVVVYSTDRANWSALGLRKNGDNGNNDRWHANLGRFRAGSTVEYAVAVIDAAGAYVWDSRGGQNYRATVVPAPSVQWIGNTYTWPAAGQASSTNDLWINVESWPKGAAVRGRVVYTTNGVAWSEAPLAKAGTNGNNDWWHVNMGRLPGGISLRFAVAVEDGNGAVRWDNNGGKDYAVTIRAAATASAGPLGRRGSGQRLGQGRFANRTK